MIIHYDGTMAGLLTVCLGTASGAEVPTAICCPPWPASDRVEEVAVIATEESAAFALRTRICRELSPRVYGNLRLAFLSGHPGIELFIWRYLALGWKLGSLLDCCQAHPDVHTVHCWARRAILDGRRRREQAGFEHPVELQDAG